MEKREDQIKNAYLLSKFPLVIWGFECNWKSRKSFPFCAVDGRLKIIKEKTGVERSKSSIFNLFLSFPRPRNGNPISFKRFLHLLVSLQLQHKKKSTIISVNLEHAASVEMSVGQKRTEPIVSNRAIVNAHNHWSIKPLNVTVRFTIEYGRNAGLHNKYFTSLNLWPMMIDTECRSFY